MSLDCMQYKVLPEEFVGGIIVKPGQSREVLQAEVRKNLELEDDAEVVIDGSYPWNLVKPWSVDRALFWGEIEGEENV